MDDVTHVADVVRAGAKRTTLLIERLRTLDDDGWAQPSALTDWTRLTIACHLRYGTRALLRMTGDALAGRVTAYYPDGRARQRPETLLPDPGEAPADLVTTWTAASLELDATWTRVTEAQWRADVVEPANNPDLGTTPLARLALARLTEVEVHGSDLLLGAPDWSDTFVHVGLRTRLAWLATRRTNHRAFDRALGGSWLLEATTGFRWFVDVQGGIVTSRTVDVGDEPRAVIRGTERDLLALLLGRPRREPLAYAGDVAFARAFPEAFPGP